MPPDMHWLAEAARLYDDDGKVGLRDRRQLIRLVARLHKRIPTDLPWCGLFVGHCMLTAFPDQRLPWLWVRGRPWRRYGRPAEPQLGAILVFWLRWQNSPFGHVGFYWGEDEDTYHVLGGNQHRSILIERFPKHRLIDCRWPPGIATPGIRRRHPPAAAAPFEHADAG
jgi:uncharacterized protein (TIGR02594 family)